MSCYLTLTVSVFIFPPRPLPLCFTLTVWSEQTYHNLVELFICCWVPLYWVHVHQGRGGGGGMDVYMCIHGPPLPPVFLQYGLTDIWKGLPALPCFVSVVSVRYSVYKSHFVVCVTQEGANFHLCGQFLLEIAVSFYMYTPFFLWHVLSSHMGSRRDLK